MQSDKDFEKFFQDRFDDFEAEPPKEGWSQIKSELKKPILPKRLWRSGLVLLLLGSTLTGYWFAVKDAKIVPDKKIATSVLSDINTDDLLSSNKSEKELPATSDSGSKPLDENSFISKTDLTENNPSAVLEENNAYILTHILSGERTSHDTQVPRGFSKLPFRVGKLKADILYKKDKKVKPKKNQKKNLALSLYFSPRYSYNRFIPNREDSVLVKDVQKDKKLKERFGYETGANLIFIGKNSRQFIGVSFIHFDESLSMNVNNGELNTLKVGGSTADGYTVSPVLQYTHYRYSSQYNYIGINYAISRPLISVGSNRLYFSGGTGISLLIRGNTRVEENGVFQKEIKFPSPKNPFQQLNYKINLGVGYQMNAFKNVDIYVEPAINYFIGSTFKKREPLGIKPYTMGVTIGLQLKK